MPSLFEVTAGKLTGPTNGGSVTQATNKTTGVTLNSESGVITMNNAALGAADEATFEVTNDKVAAADIPFVAIASGGTAGSYLLGISSVQPKTKRKLKTKSKNGNNNNSDSR